MFLFFAVDPMSHTSHLTDNPLYVCSTVVNAALSPSNAHSEDLSQLSPHDNVHRQTSLPNGNILDHNDGSEAPEVEPTSLPCLAFSNPEYVLQLSLQNGNEVSNPPPLPPKSKYKSNQKALHRTKSILSEDGGPTASPESVLYENACNLNETDASCSGSQAEDSSVISQEVYSDASPLAEDSGEVSAQESSDMDSSRPTSLDASEMTEQLLTDTITSVPLATPEGDLDSLAERLIQRQRSLEADIPESVLEEPVSSETDENEQTSDESSHHDIFDEPNDLSRETPLNTPSHLNSQISSMNICDAVEYASDEVSSTSLNEPNVTECVSQCDDADISPMEQIVDESSHDIWDPTLASSNATSASQSNDAGDANAAPLLQSTNGSSLHFFGDPIVNESTHHLWCPPTPTHHSDPALASRNAVADRLVGGSHQQTTRLPSIPERKFERVETSAGEEPLPLREYFFHTFVKSFRPEKLSFCKIKE